MHFQLSVPFHKSMHACLVPICECLSQLKELLLMNAQVTYGHLGKLLSCSLFDFLNSNRNWRAESLLAERWNFYFRGEAYQQ